MKTMNSDFKIKFDGEHHQIDANILINNLIHTTSIIQELNRNLDSGKKIEIKVKALDKGSFLIHIDLIETALEALKTIFTKDNIEIGGVVVGALVGLIELKSFLRGKEPEKIEKIGDKVKIENKKGEVIYIDNFVQNVYENNTIIRDALSQSFETLDNDNSITGYQITDKDENPLVKVDKEDFQFMSLKSDEILDGEKVTVVAARLNLVRLSFDHKLKSDFYYKGVKVSAKIKDVDFYDRIDRGESFSKGDILEVELEIKQVFDGSVNTFINKSYKVKRIIQHIKRDEQSRLNFD